MDNRIGLVLGLGLTLCAGAASAAGYYNLDQGIESFGSGASMVARPGNASAVYLNPADLAGLEGFDFMVGADYALDYRSHRVLRRLSTQRDQMKSLTLKR